MRVGVGEALKALYFEFLINHHMSKPKPTPRWGSKYNEMKDENPLVVPFQGHDHGF